MHHAPIRIKVIRDNHPAGEKEQRLGEIQDLKRRPCSFEPDPLSASADPENLRYHAVSNRKKRQVSWVQSSAFVAHGLGNKDVAKDQREVGRRANQGVWMILAYRDGFSVLAPVLLGKQFGLVKDHLISQDVISGPGQFVGQGTMGHRGILLLEFSVIEGPAPGIVSTGVLSGLRESPSQIGVAIVRIAFALDLVVADSLTGHQAAIGDVVAHVGKTLDGTGFKQNRHAQDLSHPWKAEQIPKAHLGSKVLQDPGLNPKDPVCEGIDELLTGFCGQQKSFICLQMNREQIHG